MKLPDKKVNLNIIDWAFEFIPEMGSRLALFSLDQYDRLEWRL